MNYQMNPYAPPGLAVPAPAGMKALSGIYVYERTLSANEVVTGDVLSIYTDSDFFARGIVLSQNTGAFAFRYADESGYYTSNSLISSSALPTNASVPFPIVPQLRYSAGGRILIDVTNLTAVSNTIQLLFIGTRNFVVPR